MIDSTENDLFFTVGLICNIISAKGGSAFGGISIY
jgi:hypothetical protein